MAARTDWSGVKTLVTSDHISWRIEPCVGARARISAVPLRLQKWRVVGDGRTTKEQIREYATTCLDFPTSSQTSSHSEEEVENAIVPISIPSGEFYPSSSLIRTVAEEACLEDRGHSSSITHSMVEEEETMLVQSPPDMGAAPSSGSEFTNADGYISGQEEEIQSEKEELEEDSVALTVKDAHSFRIFKPDDEEKRVPASILDLDFDCKPGQLGNTMLHLMGFSSSDSSGLFMRTIDTWSIKQEGERKLRVYVRDTKGLWVRLWKPFKEYGVSVRGARLITKFLELAMILKKTDAKKCLDHLEKFWSRDEIKTVLLKYYPSIVEKVVQSSKLPKFVRMTPIIKDMESLLRGTLEKGKLEKGKPVISMKRLLPSDETRSENNLTSGVQSSGNKRRRIDEMDLEILREKEVQKEKKNTAQTVPASINRKRVVESDSGDESGSEDHIPLAQRHFQFSERSQTSKSVPKDEQVENTVRRNELETECESRKLCPDKVASACLPLFPASNENDGSSRWNEVGIDHDGEQEYQDIADAYGGQNDGLGEIVDDDDDEELGDSAFCAICDDGGDLLLCDGPCMRSFHASIESAAKSDSMCKSLGYDRNEVREMESWKCPNCVHGQHQCFICGQLGRSEGEDKEVYICDVALCGRFYHPGCLAKWKTEEQFNGIADENAYIRGVKAGTEEFCCPAHKCRRCGKGEQEGGADNSWRLAKCRRCPKAYHKNCLPKSISFEKEPIRAWEIGDEDDPMKRLVIYCLKHEIVEHLSTPKRNHLKWPRVTSSPQNIRHKEQPKQKQLKLAKSTPIRQIPVHAEGDDGIHGNHLKGAKGSLSRKTGYEDLILAERNPSVKPDMDLYLSSTAGKDRSPSHMPKRDAPVLASSPRAPSYKQANLSKKNDLQKKNVTLNGTSKSFPTSTEGREERVLEIMRRASQNITLETVKENLAQPSCYGENKKKNFLHLGELQSMLNAIKKAAEKVKNGGSREDAKRLCPKENFLRFLKNEDMLKVHLAPILHGMRYTSFGRHFTCIDKLKEIVNRIHPYIDSGDMIVDFCCGANDFSILLNEKLSSTGKICQFMNFDIHPPKNDFCFTKGDWLINEGQGFLEGKKLIMGLNPPFGVRAALANRFIRHALRFEPKLLVLIVPPETMSYSADYSSFNYDLVWEDKELLKGHAFYLPGSVDENDGENKTQWNVVPPPLYLWSTREMVQKHRDIALRCKHIEGVKVDPSVLPDRRTPTPPAGEVSRLTTPSDNRTNSVSTPTECDTSSSRLQHSSATSSQADGHSQNSLDGRGPCLSAGGRHAVQNLSQGRQASGEQASDHIPPNQMSFVRPGFGHGPVGHNPNPLPAAGPPQNNHLSVNPNQHMKQNLASATLLSHSGSPYSNFHRNVSVAAELISMHGNPNLNQSSPRGDQAQWGPLERISRTGLDNGDRQHLGPQIPHRQQLLDPHRPQNFPGGQFPWPDFTRAPNHPFDHGLRQRFPNQYPQRWPPPPPTLLHPPPHPYLGHGIVPGLRPPFPPMQGPYLRGPPAPPDRGPGSNQHGIHKESGGWLE